MNVEEEIAKIVLAEISKTQVAFRDFKIKARSGQLWTTDEEAVLRERLRSPGDVPDLARRLGRTDVAIVSRAVRLGILAADVLTAAIGAQPHLTSPIETKRFTNLELP